jgi:hypothetical protein
MRHPPTVGVLLALSLAAACGRGGDAPHAAAVTDTAAPAAAPEAAMTAMPMLTKLSAHLDSVASHPAMLKSGMADHQAAIKAVVDAMKADMTAAGMHSDAAYEALADSVVQESAALGTASGPDFDKRVMHHVDQMRRLAAVYQSRVSAM